MAGVTWGHDVQRFGGKVKDKQPQLLPGSAAAVAYGGPGWGHGVQPFGGAVREPYSVPSVAVAERGAIFQPNFVEPITRPSGYGYADPSEQPGIAITQPVIDSAGTTDWAWYMEVYSLQRRVLFSQIRQCRLTRSSGSLQAQIHDLLAGSLVPLTHQYTARQVDKIGKQAEFFFASFDTSANWFVDVQNLQPVVGNVINGLTPNSRKSGLGDRFLRFRFPCISFEWFVQTPYFEIASCTSKHAVEVDIIWKAWSNAGAASGLVAYGFIKDSVKLEKNLDSARLNRTSFVILERHFIVTQIFQPELMTPVPYPRIVPPYLGGDDLLQFSTSWTVIQFLRSSQVRLGFLVALSALFASLQPVVANFSRTAGWVFAAAGVFSALASVFAVLFGRLLTWSEAHAARQRQYTEDK